ncbi:MAG: carboxypeptidase regulatory-like domain-containing protein, partial [Myxococcales bacterium]
MSITRIALVALVTLLAACSSEPGRTNPFDPEAALDLQAKAKIRGTLELQGSASSGGVDVHLRQQGKIIQSRSTAADGTFLFDSLVPGSYVVESAPAGYLPLSATVAVGPGDDLDLGVLSLSPVAAESAIEGEVTLESATDHAGTLVEVVGRPFAAVTTSTGAFRLEVTDGTFTLRFTHESFVTEELKDIVVGRGEVKKLERFSLRTNPATIRGHVEGELAEGGFGPLPDATVSVEGTGTTGLTNAAGDFTLTGVPTGSYLLRVVKPGFVAATVPVLNLVGGETRDLAEPIALSLARGGIRGTVSLADSNDASGVIVELVGSPRVVVTGADGHYLFEGLLADEDGYELSMRRDGYGRRSVTTGKVSAGEITEAPPVVLGRQGGAVSVSEGAFVNAREVTLAFAASGAVYYRASEDPTFSDPTLGDTSGAWHPYPASQQAAFTLSDADGEHTVWVVFSDGSSNWEPTSASVVLDRQAPSAPSITIGDGSGFTRAVGGAVALSLSALDLTGTPGAAVSGVHKMELANDASFSGASLIDYQLTTTWALADPSVDGAKTVYVRFHDRAGNVSESANATVVLDTVPPSSPAIVLRGPSPSPEGFTSSTSVTAELSASDENAGPGGAQLLVRLSNTQGFAGARYQELHPTRSWELLPGEGPKTVWAQYMDPAGNESVPVSATITLDSTAPGAPTLELIEQDSRPTNGYTNDRTVVLRLSAGDDPVAAQVAEDPVFSNPLVVPMAGLPQPVATPFALTGSGLRTVWARFIDEAGNASAAVSASVTVDEQPPSRIAPAVQPQGTTAAATVRLVPPSAGQDELRLTGNVVSPSGWIAAPAGEPLEVTLSSDDGPKSIVVTWRDLADNETALEPIDVMLDTRAPQVAASLTVSGTLADGTSDSSLTAETGVTLDILAAVSDATSGIAEM